tara:strand:- start:31 stop:156 length:126 start_codon:yes stop_codon:yes gene_type:complete
MSCSAGENNIGTVPVSKKEKEKEDMDVEMDVEMVKNWRRDW